MLRPEAQWLNPISIFFPSPSYIMGSQRQYISFRGKKKNQTKNQKTRSYVPILTHYEAKRWDTTFFIYADRASSGVDTNLKDFLLRLQL